MTWDLLPSRRRRLGKQSNISHASGSSMTMRFLRAVSILTFLILAIFRPNESLQLLPYSLEDLQQYNSLKTFSFSSSIQRPNKMNLLLYITTHFSKQHLRYFHCCWPKLVQESPLISSAHILIVASNHTPVDPTELDYLSSLFSNNPSYQIEFLSRYKNPCQKFRYEVLKGMSNSNFELKVPVNYKQCMANLGVRSGFEHGWVHANVENTASSSSSNLYDWMIRINPDVLLRKSKWLLETMQASVDAIPSSSLATRTNITTTLGIGVYCNTRQLHTDFFALRPHYWNATTAFSRMGRKGNKWNHERTAYKEIVAQISDSNMLYLPDVDPSEGSCRVRGANASVYHVHDSCLENDMVCRALDGWDLRE